MHNKFKLEGTHGTGIKITCLDIIKLLLFNFVVMKLVHATDYIQ